jgi:hypothetical protein
MSFHCYFLDRQCLPYPQGFPIDAINIDLAIDRAFDALAGVPHNRGFELRDEDRVVHHFVKQPRD